VSPAAAEVEPEIGAREVGEAVYVGKIGAEDESHGGVARSPLEAALGKSCTDQGVGDRIHVRQDTSGYARDGPGLGNVA